MTIFDETILQLISKYFILPAIAVYLVYKGVSITEKILSHFEIINEEIGELTQEVHNLTKEMQRWFKS